MRKGDVVRAELDKIRPAIVWDASDPGAVVVLWGTGTRRDVPHVCVKPFERAGTALQLTKSTYFYPRNVAVLPIHKLKETGRPCPPGVMLDLETLLREHGK